MARESAVTERARIAVLISGRGSNMVSLAQAARDGRIPNAEISVVISDQRNALGLARAKALGIETLVIGRSGTREEHDHEILAALRSRKVDLVCLAGYMRVLSREFVEAYPDRILNIHPSLLPAFPGLDAQRQALEAGAKCTGCTVHFVDETLDGGRILRQSEDVEIQADDTVETLSDRILIEEHKHYPEVVALVLKNIAESSSDG
jgi:phosphoribosylglycinamide formyltransferase 1